MPSNGTSAIFQKLVRKKPLEQNLLPALCWTSIIPNCILKLISIPIGKRSFHPSSKKLLLTENGDHDRKPQKDTMRKEKECLQFQQLITLPMGVCP